MLADDVRARGLCAVLYCTDIDEENIVKHPQQSCGRYTDRGQLFYKAKGSVVVEHAGARPDTVVQQFEVSKCEDDGKDLIQGRQREHGSGEGEEPLP